MVNGDEVNILSYIKHFFNLVKHNTCVGIIGAFGTFSLHEMHQRLSLSIGFEAEGLVSVTVYPHLHGIEGLNLTNPSFYFFIHFGAKQTIIGQEVDHSHCAGCANVQIKRVLCGSIQAIASLQVFIIQR